MHLQRKAPNNGCWAELGQYPLQNKIVKTTIELHNPLKTKHPPNPSPKRP